MTFPRSDLCVPAYLVGKTTAKEYITQFMTALVFSFGNRDFEVLTKIAAFGGQRDF